MDALIEYLYMDGYWPFVWPAYGFAAAVLIALLVSSIRAAHANEGAARRLEQARRGRSDARVKHGADDA